MLLHSLLIDVKVVLRCYNSHPSQKLSSFLGTNDISVVVWKINNSRSLMRVTKLLLLTPGKKLICQFVFVNFCLCLKTSMWFVPCVLEVLSTFCIYAIKKDKDKFITGRKVKRMHVIWQRKLSITN